MPRLPSHRTLALYCALAISPSQAQATANVLTIHYEPAPAQLREFAQQAQKDQVLEGWRSEVEQLLPEQGLTLALVMRGCDEANAFYDLDEKSITYCYEELQDAQANFQRFQGPESDQLSAEEVQLFASGWRDYIFYHELGHALIDQLEIPMLGREEDVADQISTYIWVHREDGEVILNGAIFGFDGQEEDIDHETLADGHSLNAQRYYNLMCWAYGADPERYREAGEQLPDERREGCEDEYWQLQNALEQLLPDLFSEEH